MLKAFGDPDSASRNAFVQIWDDRWQRLMTCAAGNCPSGGLKAFRTTIRRASRERGWRNSCIIISDIGEYRIHRLGCYPVVSVRPRPFAQTETSIAADLHSFLKPDAGRSAIDSLAHRPTLSLPALTTTPLQESSKRNSDSQSQPFAAAPYLHEGREHTPLELQVGGAFTRDLSRRPFPYSNRRRCARRGRGDRCKTGLCPMRDAGHSPPVYE